MRGFRKVLVLSALVASISLVAEGVSLADPVSDEGRFVQLINQDRANSGMGPLSVDGSLVGAARNQSARMASSGTISHSSNLPAEVPGGWQSLGENVGTGATVDDLHTAFMNSPGHRANVFGNYDRIGVGIAMSGSTYFVTEVFWKTASASAPATASAAAAPAASIKKCRKVKRRTICTKVKAKKKAKGRRARRR